MKVLFIKKKNLIVTDRRKETFEDSKGQISSTKYYKQN